MSTLELSILMPCLNEAETIQTCIRKARAYLTRAGIKGEVIVADNGSTDNSQTLARAAGARVICVSTRGYGAALQAGILASHGRYIIMGDADDSYDFENLDAFVAKLRDGNELVMGNRFTGGIRRGAMPFLHRYLGNPVLSFLGRLFFRVSIGDFHCGLRGFDKSAIQRLRLTTPGMEFASEMVVKAALNGLRIDEVPTALAPDGRSRRPHLRTWRDGWRHLRFLLTLCPRWLFLYPGLSLVALGIALQALLFHDSLAIGQLGLDIHTMLYAAAMSIIGLQMVWFAIFAKVYGMAIGIMPGNDRLEYLLRSITLERGIALGAVLVVGGLLLSMSAVIGWARADYGALDPREAMRTAIPSISMMIMGMEFVLASFFLGLLRSQHSLEAIESTDSSLKQNPRLKQVSS